jgi:hypothetical protein
VLNGVFPFRKVNNRGPGSFEWHRAPLSVVCFFFVIAGDRCGDQWSWERFASARRTRLTRLTRVGLFDGGAVPARSRLETPGVVLIRCGTPQMSPRVTIRTQYTSILVPAQPQPSAGQ